MNFWDQNFSIAGYKYGTAPNAFLVEQAHRLPSASDVLVPGDGERAVTASGWRNRATG